MYYCRIQFLYPSEKCLINICFDISRIYILSYLLNQIQKLNIDERYCIQNCITIDQWRWKSNWCENACVTVIGRLNLSTRSRFKTLWTNIPHSNVSISKLQELSMLWSRGLGFAKRKALRLGLASFSTSKIGNSRRKKS